jgi:hypothetical protein
MANHKRDYEQYALQIRMDENVALAWKSEAASMGKTLSEFVRLAVDAGVLVLRATDATQPRKLQSTRAGVAVGEDDRGRGPVRRKLGLKGRVSPRIRAKG